jgi:hypothetical protein
MAGSVSLYPAYWRKCAKEIRDRAEVTKDPGTRHELEAISKLYEELADWAERRQPRQIRAMKARLN